MIKYLIDANLPKAMDAWKKETVHATELRQDATDNFIWNYAIEKGLTVVTKDFDFSNRIISVKPPPRIIHFRLGNLKYAELNAFLNLNWQAIISVSENHKLVIVLKNKIETIE